MEWMPVKRDPKKYWDRMNGLTGDNSNMITRWMPASRDCSSTVTECQPTRKLREPGRIPAGKRAGLWTRVWVSFPTPVCVSEGRIRKAQGQLTEKGKNRWVQNRGNLILEKEEGWCLSLTRQREPAPVSAPSFFVIPTALSLYLQVCQIPWAPWGQLLGLI